MVIVRHDDIVDDDNESDDDDDYPGRWRRMATGKVTSGTKKKTSPIHNKFYLYDTGNNPCAPSLYREEILSIDAPLKTYKVVGDGKGREEG